MLESISLEALDAVTGGTQLPAQLWAAAQAKAGRYCPHTVARFHSAPSSRSQAQTIGNACLAEMGPVYRALGGNRQIRNAIDEAFPR